MEDQLLKTVGNRLPKCQGGAAELSTMVLGDGDELVNCPTPPTCIAHCDLCICQLSRRWQPSLALSKMFEPSHRP